jgi:hypothetical protein
VNANPSGRRIFLAGSWVLSGARRGNAIIVGPSPGSDPTFGRGGMNLMVERRKTGPSGGSRHAKTACRGALDARRAAQGRVEDSDPRHIVTHPASPQLLLANPSASADAVTLFVALGLLPWKAAETGMALRPSPLMARPIARFSPPAGARNTELVPPESGVLLGSAHGRPRGKGVHAA